MSKIQEPGDIIPPWPNTPELEELVSTRREFHSYPETMWTEFWTTSRICKHLEKLGCEMVVGKDLYMPGAKRYAVPPDEEMKTTYDAAMENGADTCFLEKMKGGYTGVLAVFKTGKKGAKTVLRFDMDGLPIRESTEKDHLPARESFASKNKNMHACAHDGHITIGLGIARRIDDAMARDELCGEYYILFQPAEEGGVGGGAMALNPLISKADYFATLHLGIYPHRRMICGLSFLSLQKYSIQYHGRETHAAAYPDEGRNSLQAACSAVAQLYAIPRHKDGASRINVGCFHSDNALNIISPTTKFKLELRGETNTIQQHMDNHAKKILEGTASIHGCQCTIADDGSTIASDNNPKMIRMAAEAAVKKGIPPEAVIDRYTVMGSEDATYIMEAVKKAGGEALYIGLGSNTRGGHHTPNFDFDEDLLAVGVDVIWEMIRRINNGDKRN